jgi:hypothetical protein
VWVKFVYRDLQNNVVGEKILDSVHLKPLRFEFCGAFFWIWKTTRHGHQRQMISICNVGAPIFLG